MNAKPVLARPHVVTTIVSAALSALIAIGLLSAVIGLFQRDGAPFEQVVIAEHDCTERVQPIHQAAIELIESHVRETNETRNRAKQTQ